MLQSMRNPSAMCFIILAILIYGVGDSHADAPLGQYVVSNGTVFDTKSQLTWEQNPSGELLTWNEAMAHCLNLQLAGPGWRAPSMKELQTIVDESRVDPAIDVTAFPKTALGRYWTSSQRMANTGDRWLVSFDYGGSSVDSLNGTYPVRCVR